MLLLGLVCAAVAAGCGSSPPHVYSRGATTACLKTKPVRLGGPLDFVASTATGGAVKIHTSTNFLTVVFGKTVDDASNIADAYRRFAAKNVGIDDVLLQDQNAVMLWHDHWSQPDFDLVSGCLK
jgi:hypothetical protein